MSKFSNKKKTDFIASLPPKSLDDADSDHARRCKFNFSYVCVDPAGVEFRSLSDIRLVGLFEKLTHFGKNSLDHWKQEPIGQGSGRVLSIYGGFPSNSDFAQPKHVPHQALWGRFRIDSATRLCGFVVPADMDGKSHVKGGKFCANTFYVVFYDDKHRFYKTRD